MNLQANLHRDDGVKTGQLDYELIDNAPMVIVQVDVEAKRVQAYLRRTCTENGDQMTADYYAVTTEQFAQSLDPKKVHRAAIEHRLKQVAELAASM